MNQGDYEKLEGKFHDALGTFFEVVLHTALINEFSLDQETLSVDRYELSMAECIESLKAEGDDRAAMLREEQVRVAGCGPRAVQELMSRPELLGQTVVAVEHTASDYVDGKACDIQIELAGGRKAPVSLKTDKSGKVALADIGQTGLEKACLAFYGADESDLRRLAEAELQSSLEEVKTSYYNASDLFRRVMIETLEIEAVDVNDFSVARATNTAAVRHLLGTVKGALHGSDESTLLIVDRSTGLLSAATCMDTIDPKCVSADDISFTPGSPKEGKPVGTTIGIKLRGPDGGKSMTLFDHQVKHQRGRNPSDAFRDVTTRVKT